MPTATSFCEEIQEIRVRTQRESLELAAFKPQEIACPYAEFSAWNRLYSLHGTASGFGILDTYADMRTWVGWFWDFHEPEWGAWHCAVLLIFPYLAVSEVSKKILSASGALGELSEPLRKWESKNCLNELKCFQDRLGSKKIRPHCLNPGRKGLHCWSALCSSMLWCLATCWLSELLSPARVILRFCIAVIYFVRALKSRPWTWT